ncbi:MAG: MucR family transcriptional regulator [Mesorhizobium sp.]|nr:MucR family transcriptional regulator [Mesorhizobium sp.]
MSKIASSSQGASLVEFDYESLPQEERETLQEDARQIRDRLVETTAAMIDIGNRLTRARDILPHGAWLPWLLSETGMSEQWARNCMNLSRRFADRPGLLAELDIALPPTAIVRLATAPESAYGDILGRVRDGQKLRVTDVEEVIRQYRVVELAIADEEEPTRRSRKQIRLGGESALWALAERALKDLVPLVVQRAQAVLEVFEAAEASLRDGRRVTAESLKGLYRDAQWLTDALEQLTQRRAAGTVGLVHRTHLDRAPLDGPWSSAGEFLRSIASSDAISLSLKEGVPAFVERGAMALREALSTGPVAAKLPEGLQESLETVYTDGIICLEDGQKVSNLVEHLKKLGIDPDAYRRKWGLPVQYPMQSWSHVIRSGDTYEFDLETGTLRPIAKEAVALGSTTVGI